MTLKGTPGGVTAGNHPRPFERESIILALILEVGLNFPAISRRSGIPLETVRYLYREHIRKKRMSVARELDHDKLGLEHVQFIVASESKLGPLFWNRALGTSVWTELYASAVYRTIPDNLYLVDHLAPPRLLSRLRGFYRGLEDVGAVTVDTVYECSRLTHPRMWVEDYDWELPGWRFDWSPSSLKPQESIEGFPRSEPVKFDKTDLNIVHQLQIDYDQKMAAVAAKCAIGRSSASWHFRKHVEALGLFGDYRIGWHGWRGLPRRAHSYAWMNLIANDLSSQEMTSVRTQLHSIPYLWSEKLGNSDYDAEILIPLQSLTEAFGFLSRILRPLEGRARIFTIDPSAGVNCAVNPELFDEDERQWIYKGDLILEGLKTALARGSAGSGRKPREPGRARSGSRV